MVVVCGEALIDVIEKGDGSRRAAPGGGPFNTARALARLGVTTGFLGHLSDDAEGRRLARLLEADGADLILATVGQEPTTSAIARVDESGVARYEFNVEGTSAPQLTPAMLPERLPREVRAIHIGSLGLVLEPMASTLLELVRREREGRVVMLDPNVRPGLMPDAAYRERLLSVIPLCTVVKASATDLGWIFPELGVEGAAERLLAEGVGLVVVTQGDRGAFAAHGEHRLQVDAVRVDVVDTIGAGDAFGAALLAWLHDHDALAPNLRLLSAEVAEALHYACLAGALTCTRAGAEPPWRWEMQAR